MTALQYARLGAAPIGVLALLVTLGGCVATGGGGGGGDCRDADEACSPGFACVAVANGSAYACRAACDGPDDCLRDEICGPDGICVDRPPRVPEEDAEVTEVVVDMRVEDAQPIRIIDASPDAAPPVDSDVVVILPPDMGPDPGGCMEPRDPAAELLMGLEIVGFEGFPVYFEVHAVSEGDTLALTFEALTQADRSPTGVGAQTRPFAAADGRFETNIIELLVPPSANQLGGELVMRVALVGTIRGDGAICGVLEGEMVDPPIGDISGSVFAGRATRSADADPWIACDGCLP